MKISELNKLTWKVFADIWGNVSCDMISNNSGIAEQAAQCDSWKLERVLKKILIIVHAVYQVLQGMLNVIISLWTIPIHFFTGFGLLSVANVCRIKPSRILKMLAYISQGKGRALDKGLRVTYQITWVSKGLSPIGYLLTSQAALQPSPDKPTISFQFQLPSMNGFKRVALSDKKRGGLFFNRILQHPATLSPSWMLLDLLSLIGAKINGNSWQVSGFPPLVLVWSVPSLLNALQAVTCTL